MNYYTDLNILINDDDYPTSIGNVKLKNFLYTEKRSKKWIELSVSNLYFSKKI